LEKMLGKTSSTPNRFNDVNMDNSLLIIIVTPKTGTPKEIVVHFYPDMNKSRSKIDGLENENR